MAPLSSLSNPYLNVLFVLSAAASSACSAEPLAAAAEAAPSNGTTVYDLLPKYGLPPGLLPDTVVSFSLAENGSFEVELEGPCYVDFEYLVYYDRRITGTIRYGGIEDLKGIQVRRFFIWLDVDAIMVDLPPADYIYFQVGFVTKKLLVGQFEAIHTCRDNGIRFLDATKRIFQLPEPVFREIGMLITE